MYQEHSRQLSSAMPISYSAQKLGLFVTSPSIHASPSSRVPRLRFPRLRVSRPWVFKSLSLHVPEFSPPRVSASRVPHPRVPRPRVLCSHVPRLRVSRHRVLRHQVLRHQSQSPSPFLSAWFYWLVSFQWEALKTRRMYPNNGKHGVFRRARETNGSLVDTDVGSWQ